MEELKWGVGTTAMGPLTLAMIDQTLEKIKNMPPEPYMPLGVPNELLPIVIERANEEGADVIVTAGQLKWLVENRPDLLRRNP